MKSDGFDARAAPSSMLRRTIESRAAAVVEILLDARGIAFDSERAETTISFRALRHERVNDERRSLQPQYSQVSENGRHQFAARNRARGPAGGQRRRDSGH